MQRGGRTGSILSSCCSSIFRVTVAPAVGAPNDSRFSQSQRGQSLGVIMLIHSCLPLLSALDLLTTFTADTA